MYAVRMNGWIDERGEGTDEWTDGRTNKYMPPFYKDRAIALAKQLV